MLSSQSIKFCWPKLGLTGLYSFLAFFFLEVEVVPVAAFLAAAGFISAPERGALPKLVDL